MISTNLRIHNLRIQKLKKSRPLLLEPIQANGTGLGCGDTLGFGNAELCLPGENSVEITIHIQVWFPIPKMSREKRKEYGIGKATTYAAIERKCLGVSVTDDESNIDIISLSIATTFIWVNWTDLIITKASFLLSSIIPLHHFSGSLGSTVSPLYFSPSHRSIISFLLLFSVSLRSTTSSLCFCDSLRCAISLPLLKVSLGRVNHFFLFSTSFSLLLLSAFHWSTATEFREHIISKENQHNTLPYLL